MNKTLMRSALAAMALAASGAANAAVEWGPVTKAPGFPTFIVMGNTGWPADDQISFSFLNGSQQSSLDAFLAANPLDQSATLSLFFADDGDGVNWWSGNETSDYEYFQYSLNGGATWTGTLTSQFEVDGSICFAGSMSVHEEWCRNNAYWSFDIDILDAILAGTTSIGLRVNPDYEYTTYRNGRQKTKDHDQDFYFKGTTLTARGSVSVPEPATLGLLGLGLLAMGAMRRRKLAS